MSHLYKRMLLIQPDIFEKAQNASVTPKVSSHEGSDTERSRPSEKEVDDHQQTDFLRREMIKDSLSPIASMVDVLAHLQKEMARVLQNDTLDTEEKLANYNQLMTKSQLLTSKAKSMTWNHMLRH